VRLWRRIHAQGDAPLSHMEAKVKILFLAIFAIFSAGCATNQPAAASNSSAQAGQASPASSGHTGKAEAERKAEGSKAGPAESGDRPVEFTSLGITQDKQSVAYRIKVSTAKPIEEVHLALTEMDSGGKVVENATIVWQNIVKSTRQPIVSGNTYEDQATLDPGTAKAECSLKEVVFKDGTRWSAR
jgi:hypothetical protein